MSEEQVYATVSRVLCVTWKERNESAIFLPETASASNDLMQEGNTTVDIQVKCRICVGTLYSFSRGAKE